MKCHSGKGFAMMASVVQPRRISSVTMLNLKKSVDNPIPENSISSLPKTILLVDDVDEFRVTTKWFLSNFGFAVESARSAEEALARFDPKIHDVVVTDNSMSGMSGAEMAHVIKLRSPSTPVLMYTGLAPEDRSCVDLVIQRPAHMLALKEGVDKLLARQG
jgi:CheY-like chemotaxis protein